MGISNYGGQGINLTVRGSVAISQNSTGVNLTNNAFSLAAGAILTIPAGPFNVSPGPYSMVQFKDPITGEWRLHSTNGANPTYIESDGANWRVANLTGCVVGVKLTTAGSAYTSVPTVAFSAGGATATAIMGQVVATGGTTITNGGANYTMAPTCIVSPPATGGFPAKATATITNGVVTAVTITDQGAGYGAGPAGVAASLNAPTILFVPNPEDPNINSSTSPITPATAVLTLDATTAGTVTGVLVTNPGLPQTAVPTISFTGGGGSSAAATALMCFTVTAQTVSGGTGFGATNLYTTAGGLVTAASAYTSTYNPISPVRPAQGVATASAGALTTVAIGDGGLFQAIPTGIVVGSALITASPTISTPTVGGVTDSVVLQAI